MTGRPDERFELVVNAKDKLELVVNANDKLSCSAYKLACSACNAASFLLVPNLGFDEAQGTFDSSSLRT